jgi:murein DD-endopeptidase MepM/ murein hydrolase activator NlpD
MRWAIVVLAVAACSGSADGAARDATTTTSGTTPSSSAGPSTPRSDPTAKEPSMPTVPSSSSPTSTTSTTAAPEPPAYVFPVQPPAVADYAPAHHDYPAADMFAPCGSEVVAVTAGVVSEVTRRDDWDPAVNDGATRGGLSVTVVGDDGVRYYGSHLSSVDPSISPDVRVSAGQRLGEVGDSGNAAGTGCHLHFGISPPCGTGDWEVRRGTVGPAPFLDAWRSGMTRASPYVEVDAWRRAHPGDCP